MLLFAMSTIYHSSLCDEELKQATLTELVNRGILKEGEEPPPIHVNAPLKEVNTKKFMSAIQDDFDRYQVLH